VREMFDFGERQDWDAVRLRFTGQSANLPSKLGIDLLFFPNLTLSKI